MTIQLLDKLWPQFLRFPFRYYVMFLSSISGAFMFASRCVINVAILAMVTTQVSPRTNNLTDQTLVSLLSQTKIMLFKLLLKLIVLIVW